MPTKGKLIVPSDIAILEEKYASGPRRLRLFERTGLLGILPMWHIRYAKNDRRDLRRVLSNTYGPPPKNASDYDKDIVEILLARQKSIRKRVLSQNFMWAGVLAGTGTTWYSFRHYDLKAKAIILPFAAYGFSFIGRWIGDLATNRHAEFGRNRFLGELPARQYFVEPA